MRQGAIFSFILGIIQVNALDFSENNGLRKSSLQRRDGGLCFELPSWQQKPVDLSQHLADLQNRFNPDARKMQPLIINSEMKRYINNIVVQFLDLYLRNIRTEYDDFTTKIQAKIKEAMSASVREKDRISVELTKLASELDLPETCNEERRKIKTLASSHVAATYDCVEESRVAISKMSKYVQEMIRIIKQHLQYTTPGNTITVQSVQAEIKNVTTAIKQLSRETVNLGYELDVSLSNARKHVEQTYDDLASCSKNAIKDTGTDFDTLKIEFKQCVFA